MTVLPRNAADLEARLGHIFTEKQLLQTALTHSSYSNEMRAHGQEIACNERLEFLGDSVLSLTVSEYLYAHYDRPEGDLTRIRAAVVCERALAKFAAEIALGDYLMLGRGEDMNNGRARASILADAFEAVLAALFLDGGRDTVRTFLMPLVCKELETLETTQIMSDYKTALQQVVQQAEGERLEYVLVGESGPDHQKQFEVEARLNSNVIGRGRGKSKREAEQNAAREAMKLFVGDDE